MGVRMRWILLPFCLLVAGCDKIPGTTNYKIAAGQRAAAAHLRDPSSAQFRESKLSSFEKDGNRHAVVCGEINGKNTYGAYAGFQRFIATVDGTHVLLDPQTGSSKAKADAAFKSCQEAVRLVKQGSELKEAARFECDKARDETNAGFEQEEFEMAFKSTCSQSEK